uniref:uncharacterized protein LOC120333216 n=1 Tax=Styela clava TaxID=7725 RepID=UPI00193A323C|nr:uncharacterized protein LOC120333216 [Styela clava]
MAESSRLTPRMLANLEEDVYVVNYLEGRKTIFLGLGIAQVVICGIGVILSAIAVPAFVFVASEPIVSGAFLITMAIRPTKWLAAVNLVLSILSTIAGFYGFVVACIILSEGDYVGIGVVFLLFYMALMTLFSMAAIYASLALSCCVCCRRGPVSLQGIPVTSYSGGAVAYPAQPGLATVTVNNDTLPPVAPASQTFSVNT